MRAFLIAILTFLFLNSTAAIAAKNANEEMDVRILSLLRAQDFNKLEAMLNKFENDYENDYRKERSVDLAFDSFYRNHADLEPLLNNWIKEKPNSHAAYMARGVYYTQNGWAKRGARYIDETSKEQLDGMAYFFQKAIKDFERVRSINGRMLHPILYEIEILMNFSQNEQVRKLYEEALQINPMSLTARWYYISTLLPRWGGSIKEIEKEIEAARPYYAKNQALKILDGRVSSEQGEQSFNNNDYAKAEKLYTEALKYGNHWFYNEQRGEAYYSSGQYEHSIRDMKVALELRPNYNRAMLFHGLSLYQLDRYKEAIQVFSRAIDNNPNDHYLLAVRGDCYQRSGKLDLALSDTEKAIALAPDNAQYLANRDQIQVMMIQARLQK